jgi:hypothetical protein
MRPIRTVPRPAAAFRAAALGLILVAAGGCAGPQPLPDRDMLFLSDAGRDKYLEARDAWFQLHAAPLSAEELDEGRRRRVIRALQDAVAHDGRCFLFHSKLGDMRLDAVALRAAPGPEAETAHAVAFNHYVDALRLCPDWPPAWLGLAVVARLEGRAADARRYLDAADAALESLGIWDRPPPPTLIRVFATVAGADAAAGLDATFRFDRFAHDPRVSPATARRITMSWMKESGAWNAGARFPSTFSAASADDDVFAPVRALVEAERAALDLDEALAAYAGARNPDDPAYRALMLRYADRLRGIETIAKNVFVVKYRLGAAYLEAGDLESARAQFEAYLDFRGQPSPLAAQYDPLLLSLTAVYARRYVAVGGAERLEELVGFCRFAAATAGFLETERVPLWAAAQRFFDAHGRGDRAARAAALETLERVQPSPDVGALGWTQEFAERLRIAARGLAAAP